MAVKPAREAAPLPPGGRAGRSAARTRPRKGRTNDRDPRLPQCVRAEAERPPAAPVPGEPCKGERIQVEFSQVAKMIAGLRSQIRKRGGSRLSLGAGWQAEDSAPRCHGHGTRKKTCQDPALTLRGGVANCSTPTPGVLVKTRHGW